MRRKGFTLVELLVVIAIIALLMGILMPALARVRQLAFRMTCGTNLSGIGKAMLIYANDYEDELPRAGWRQSSWGAVLDWTGGGQTGTGRIAAFGPDGTSSKATISSCFYLLVKYAEVTPKSFICKGDAGTSEFKLGDLQAQPWSGFELIDGWDFGPDPTKRCSYAYHNPFPASASTPSFALTTSSEPGFAVAADRNPWITSPASAGKTNFAQFKPDIDPWKASSDVARIGNAIAHQDDGQNVLFLDSHVNFEKRSYCSLEDDNLYTSSSRSQNQLGDPLGNAPAQATLFPACRKDSVLVHDDPTMFGGGTTPSSRTRTPSSN